MKKMRIKYPVWVSLFLMLLMPLLSGLIAIPAYFFPQLREINFYLLQLVAELVLLAGMLVMARLLGMGYTFRPSRQSFRSKLLPCLPLLLIYTLSLFGSAAAAEIWTLEPLPVSEILYFLLCMLVVGLTEELIFRGLITRMIYEKYGRTSVGVWFSVLFSSLLFGVIHISNAVNGEIALQGVLIQVVAAICLGICLSAIYLRTGSYWTVALLHGYMDFCALFTSGVFGVEDFQDVVGGYGAVNLVSPLLYGLLGLFLLRPSQMKKLTKPGAQAPESHVIALMLVILLLSGLISAVAVWST